MAPPPPAAPVYSLQQRLQTLMEDSRESLAYAIFWQPSLGDSHLSWGDGYYNGFLQDKQIQHLTTNPDEQARRKRVLRELNSLICGDCSNPNDVVDEEVPDMDWFFLTSFTHSFAAGEGLPGQALLTGMPLWVAGASHLAVAPCERAKHAHTIGVQTMAFVPVNFGVLEIASTELIFQSTEIMGKIKLLFDFKKHDAGGGSAWGSGFRCKL